MPTEYVAVVAVCLGGVALAVRDLWKGWTTWQLGRRGLPASATILAVQSIAQPTGGPVQRLEVVYRAHTGAQYRRWLVAGTDADGHVAGDEIGVRYDARRPEHCVPDALLAAPWWESPRYRGLLLLGVFVYFLWEAVQHLRL